MQKVILGLSGGVDSAVSAALLRQDGYDVHGLYLDAGGSDGAGEAALVADFLGIPLTVLDVREELERRVCAPFAAAYLRGETPNPCVVCNRVLKFKSLLSFAEKLGAEYIATGHYARAEGGQLFKGRARNDQSYMLCRLTADEAARLLLPLGGFEKDEVRAIARQLNLPPAEKADSMEICFIPDNDYIGWLERRGGTLPDGNFLFHGEVAGRHGGLHHWTVGQRIPGLYNERKLYIGEIRPETNEIVLALWEELFKTEVRVRDMSWLIPPPLSPIRASVKVRHTKWECPECTVQPCGEGAVITTDEPLRAPARGQAAALYDGERLIGGGIII